MMSHQKKVLLLDMDGILAEFNSYTVERYNQTYGENHDVKYADYLIGDSGPTDGVLNHEKIVALFNIPGYFKDMPPKAGAVEAVALLEKFFDVHVVTKVFPDSCLDTFREKVEWMKIHIPSLKHKMHLITGSKVLVKGDVFVDDASVHQKAWKAAWPNGIVASLQYPWTDSSQLDIVADNWSDLAKILILHSGDPL